MISFCLVQFSSVRQMQTNLFCFLLCFLTARLTGARWAHHGVRSGGAGECVPGEDAAGHRDRGRPGHRVRWGRGLRRLPLTGGRGRQRDGFLWQVQCLCSSGQQLWAQVLHIFCLCTLVELYALYAPCVWSFCRFLQNKKATEYMNCTKVHIEQFFHKYFLWQPEAGGALLCLSHGDRILIIVSAQLALTHYHSLQTAPAYLLLWHRLEEVSHHCRTDLILICHLQFL